MQLIAEIKDRQRGLASWRQHLHQHPEIAYEETITSDFVAAKLEGFGIKVHRGLGKTGLVGVIHGQGGGGGAPSTGLRADMDALPMEERTNLAYSSRHPDRMPAAMMAIRQCFLALPNIWRGQDILTALSTAFSSSPRKAAMPARGR